MAPVTPATTPQTKPKPSRKASRGRNLSFRKVEIKINVYDLLPPGNISSILWFLGSSLLHTGVVIGDKEYAYGGHDQPHTSGVYWTRPRLEPPGGTFRIELLHGFSFLPEAEIDAIVHDVSSRFLGVNYNLLTNNCNHFTAHLCDRLVRKPPPPWLNRAASIGLLLPCVVPREWISPPDCDTADGELVEVDDEDADEHARMLRHDRRYPRHSFGEGVDEEQGEVQQNWRDRRRSSASTRLANVTDTSGRTLPVAERAPMPHGFPQPGDGE